MKMNTNIITPAKIEKYLCGMNEIAKNQVIRFLLDDTPQNNNKAFIFRQREEFSRMYPELKGERE